MAVRTGVVPVGLGACLVAAAYASAFLPGGAPTWGAWLMVLGIALLFVGVMALGAIRPGRTIGGLRWPLGFTFLVLVAGFGLALVLPAGERPGIRLWGGLPPRAALVLYGIGLLPAVVLPLAYAMTFRSMTLDREDVERIRAARPQASRSGGPLES